MNVFPRCNMAFWRTLWKCDTGFWSVTMPLAHLVPLHIEFSPWLSFEQMWCIAFSLFSLATLSGSYCSFQHSWGELRHFSLECRWTFKLMTLRWYSRVCWTETQNEQTWCFLSLSLISLVPNILGWVGLKSWL